MSLFNVTFKDMNTRGTLATANLVFLPRIGEELVFSSRGTYIVKNVRYVVKDGTQDGIQVMIELDRKY